MVICYYIRIICQKSVEVTIVDKLLDPWNLIDGPANGQTVLVVHLLHQGILRTQGPSWAPNYRVHRPDILHTVSSHSEGMDW